MTKFPLIESMNLVVIQKDGGSYISATLLEKALQDAPVRYGVPKLDSWSSADICPHDTHTARLVCFLPRPDLVDLFLPIYFAHFSSYLKRSPHLLHCKYEFPKVQC
mgnify:CR=1 FL=1